MERLISFFGLFVMMFLAWVMSSNRRIIPYRIIVGGVLLQITLGWLILRTAPGHLVFAFLGDFFNDVLDFVDAGALFVFGKKFREFYFAFKVLPTIIFFSAFMSVLYHFGIMQTVVRALSIAMQKLLKTSGAETLAASVNVFVGQTEAPLVIKPYLCNMTRSELMAVMVGGFANIAGGVLAAYVGMGVDAAHLITASVMSAPASLLIAKILEPETEIPQTMGKECPMIKPASVNLVDAISLGATEGLSLALNVAAMLIAFLGMMALLDSMVIHGSAWVGYPTDLASLLGRLFSPLAWVMGVPFEDIHKVGQLLGLKMVANEFVAYEKFSQWLVPGSEMQLSERAKILTTYALCGFANFGSIGIQIGGITPLAPEKRHVIAQIGLRAMLGGTLATFMCACVAGMLL